MNCLQVASDNEDWVATCRFYILHIPCYTPNNNLYTILKTYHNIPDFVNQKLQRDNKSFVQAPHYAIKSGK